MGYFSCSTESGIATCDPYNWPDLKKKTNRNKPITIRKFPYDLLLAATNGFSVENFLGIGSHGSVYKAVLDNGKLIAAVKKTNAKSNSGSGTGTPAENEIEILAGVQTSRIVNLIGFSTDPNGNKLIVVEYMPNGSLFDLLHSDSVGPGWPSRVRFGLQVAKAVQLLHFSNPPVIHRDIKSSNVLIDGFRNARLGDFGLSLRGHADDVRVTCTPPAGTLGYLDPTYIVPGDVSVKSDVFSFGILLLEIISGRHAIDLNYSPPSIDDWAVPMIKRSEFAGICDGRLETPRDSSVVSDLAVLAARCVRSRAEKRPDMTEVVDRLTAVNKKMQSAPLIWNSLKQRVSCVEKSQPLIRNSSFSEEVSNNGVSYNYKRIGSTSRSNYRKVSSVEYRKGSGVDRAVDFHYKNNNGVVRSRSVGSGSGIQQLMGKSRSMGMLRSPKIVQNKNGGVDLAKHDDSRDSKLIDEEKPLVFSG